MNFLDGVSFSSSISTFVPSILAIKAMFIQDKPHRKRLCELTKDITRRLHEVETFFARHREALGDPEAMEFKDALKTLSSDLQSIQLCCEELSTLIPRARFSVLKRNLKNSIKRSSLDVELDRLERSVRVAHIRFIEFSSARVEHNVLVMQQENNERLAQWEALVSRMFLLNCNGDSQPFPLCVNTEPGAIELKFLERQALRLLDGIDHQKGLWADLLKSPGLAEDTHFVHLDEPRSATFHDSLLLSLRNLQGLGSQASWSSVYNLANEVGCLAINLHYLGLDRVARLVIRQAANIISSLGNSANSTVLMAMCLYWTSTISEDVPEALAAMTRSTQILQDLYEQNGGDSHFNHLVSSLCHYSYRLWCHGDAEKALDYSQQALILLRYHSISPDPDHPIVSWSASGEAAVIFSSERSFERPYAFAFLEFSVLREIAYAFALSGLYSEAWISGHDAINCLEAIGRVCLASTPKGYDGSLVGLRRGLATWTPVYRCPSFSTESVKEVRYAADSACTSSTVLTLC
ncbi:hypothetical protein HGRIS_006981 [Hohenbuehelia grisea]|uniref:Fungal N-terminal domain-containing protein n=1 Tax=Hohenbuehelia grisea TaxID=104357 RepID=A0ABR3JB00_9AGAR